MPACTMRLGAGIDRAGRLIEDHNRRIGNRRTRDGKQLALPLRKTAAVAVDARYRSRPAVGVMKSSALASLSGSHDFLVGRIQATVADIHRGWCR